MTERTEEKPVVRTEEEAARYRAMDEKLRPVARFLCQQQPDLALEKLRELRRQDIFLPTELWRVYQRMGDAY